MRKLYTLCSVFFMSVLVIAGQEAVSYTVRFKPILIIDQATGEVITKVPKSKSVILSSYNTECDCFRAQYGEFTGIIPSKSWLGDIYGRTSRKYHSPELSDSVKLLLTKYRLANDREPDNVFTLVKNTSQGPADTDKTIDLINRWGYTIGKRISEGKIWPGMSVEMALESWGIPYRVNVTRGSWGTHEQWKYSEAYLYFENGILSEIFRLNKNPE